MSDSMLLKVTEDIYILLCAAPFPHAEPLENEQLPPSKGPKTPDRAFSGTLNLGQPEIL